MNVCPPWMYPNPQQHNECGCATRVGGAILCDQESSAVYILDFYCIFYSEELNTTLIGTCPYNLHTFSLIKLFPFFNGKLCSCFHRKGRLCGECEDNYTLPVYLYYPGCVKCDDYRCGITFIVVAFLPLTVFLCHSDYIQNLSYVVFT